jgi:hypothetical protein
MSSNALVTDASIPSRYDLSHLADQDVLSGTRRVVGASNQLCADLLAHLAEIEARGIHRAKACSSLYTYCIYELRFSEDAAFRRSSAARWVKAFPVLLDAVASGELHLTGLLMLGPHLTAANCQEVLARAKHRTKKELATLVRELDLYQTSRHASRRWARHRKRAARSAIRPGANTWRRWCPCATSKKASDRANG